MAMSEQACVSIEVRDNGVATIRINRAEAKNALNMATRQQLAAHFHAASADARVHAIVLTGGDACFVACAHIWAIPHPMAPVPTTAMLLIDPVMVLLSDEVGSTFFQDAAAPSF